MFETTTSLLLNLMLAAALGGLIGVEREFGREVEKKVLMFGLRTCILISILGFLFSYISLLLKSIIPLVISFITILVIATSAYFARLQVYKAIGATTYTAIFITFIIGMLVGFEKTLFAVVLAVLTAAFLAYRTELHSAVKILKKEEIESAIKFAIVAFVILPLLPNKAIDPFGLSTHLRFGLLL